MTKRRLLSTTLALLTSAFVASASAAPPKPTRRLSRKVKKIDLNTAPLAALLRLPGVGPKRAQAIVALRARRPFKRIRDLRSIQGIGPKLVKKIRPWVTVSTAAPKKSSSPSRPSPGGGKSKK